MMNDVKNILFAEVLSIYENSNQIWKPCETNSINFTCSICPKGTFIKNSSSQVCEKCPEGEFSKNEGSEKCENALEGFTPIY